MKWWFISCFFLALYFWRLSVIPQYVISENKKVKIVGRITQQTYLKSSYQIIEVGPILIRTNRFPGYFYGEKIMMVGEFKKQVINPFTVKYSAFFPAIQKIDEKENLWGRTKLVKDLLKTRGQVEENFNLFLPEPSSSLLLGVVFGVKSQMPENFWQNLRKTGTLHLVVASGQNVVMVSAFLMNTLVWFLKRRWAILMALLGIIIYVLMVGAQSTAVRAGVMASIIFLGQLLGREGNQVRLLLLTAMIMLLILPLILFDIGFQLSFAATAGIILFYPTLKNKSLSSIPLLGEGLSVTLSAQIFSLPLLLINFGQFSWLSPLVNSLVLPTIPFMMILGGITAGLSLFSKSFGQLLSWLVWPFLAWFVKIINWFGNLPLGNWEIGRISWWWAIGYYAFLAFFLWRINGRKNS
jgi:competence protein ComEC